MSATNIVRKKRQSRLTVRAIIFDRDGTILDLTETFYQFLRWAAPRHGFQLPPRNEVVPNLRNEDYWSSLTGGQTSFRLMVREHFEDIPKMFLHHARLYEGVKEALETLKGMGVGMALTSAWSGTEETRRLLGGTGVEGLFLGILTRDDLEVKTDVYNMKLTLMRRASEWLTAHPTETVVVGDTANDVKAGRCLGFKTVGVLTGAALFRSGFDEEKPDTIIESVAKLPKIIPSI